MIERYVSDLEIFDGFTLHGMPLYSNNRLEEGVIYTSHPNFRNWNNITLNRSKPNNLVFVRRRPEDWIIYKKRDKLLWRIPDSDGEFYEKNDVYYAYLGLPQIGRNFNPDVTKLSYHPNRLPNQIEYPLSKIRFSFPDFPWTLGLSMSNTQFGLYMLDPQSDSLFSKKNFLKVIHFNNNNEASIGFFDNRWMLNLKNLENDITGTFEQENSNDRYYYFRFPKRIDYYSSFAHIPLSFGCEIIDLIQE